MRRWRFGIAAMMVALAVAACSPESGSGGKDRGEKAAAAQGSTREQAATLMRAAKTREVTDAQIDLMLRQLGQQGAPSGMVRLLREELQPLLNKLPETAEKFYAAEMTAQELSAAITFLRSPAGRSLVDSQIELVQLLHAEEQRISPAALARVQTRLGGGQPSGPPVIARQVSASLDPTRVRLAQDVLRLQRKREQIEQLATAALQKGGANLNQLEMFRQEFAPVWDTLLVRVVEHYVSRFSAEDLRAMREYYQSQAGSRFVAKEYELAIQMFDEQFDLGVAAGQRARARYEAGEGAKAP